jgi:hypothetical protein
LTKLSLAGARLGRQYVASERMATRYFAGPGLFKALGRTLMCLQLGHKLVLECADWRKPPDAPKIRNSDLDAELL